MRAFRAATLTDLHERLCHTIVHAPAGQLDVISSVDVQIHDTISQAESMAWEFDLKSMWLTPSRWSTMIRQYIDPAELLMWIEKCTGRVGLSGRGIAHMRTKTVAARGGAATGHTNKETRRWGSCMLGISYKAMPRPTITLHSRTSYLGYLAALDLSVAWMCARYLAKAMGCRVEDFSFVWMNEALQYHNFKSLAFLLNHRDADQAASYRRILLEKRMTSGELALLKASPALTMSRRWMARITKLDDGGQTYGDMTYNTYRRIRRRYHTEVLGFEAAKEFEGWSYYKTGDKVGQQKEWFKAYPPLPSTPVQKLDFAKIGLPLNKSYGAEYVGDEEDEDDDDE